MRFLGLAFLILFTVVVGVFALSNLETVTLRFWSMSFEAPLAVILAGVYVLGMVSGWSVVRAIRSTVQQQFSQQEKKA